MNKQERKDYERQVEQTDRSIAAMERLAAAFERVADAQEAQAVVVNASFAMSKGLVAPAGAVVVATQ
jgi:hypothetical protein